MSRPWGAEVMPRVGENLVLPITHIRYCLAEDIRLDAAKSVVNNYSSSDVARFNAMVNDYNSRCAKFRYRSGALEIARQDVEKYRNQLRTEGFKRFPKRRPETGWLAPSRSSLPQPDVATASLEIDGTANAVPLRESRA